jgi:RNA polymerase sigma factor (sigma-70 family)
MELEIVLENHRERLYRWLTSLTSDPQAAEDLTQETLIEAWKNRHKLTDPEHIDRWLNAIAYHVYQRWGRARGKEIARTTDLLDELPAPEIQLEQDEMADLLDQAMELLPPETRALLITHYLEGLPQAKIAEHFRMKESAVGVALHRGKLRLRQILTTDPDGWQTTRIWCPTCGQRCYEGKLENGELALRCPVCNSSPQVDAWKHCNASNKNILEGVHSFKPAFTRVMIHTENDVRHALPQRRSHCEACNAWVDIQLGMPDEVPPPYRDDPAIHMICPHCGHRSFMNLSGVTLASAEGRAFWRDFPRLYMLPHYKIEYENRPAVVITGQSWNTDDQLVAIFAQDTHEVLTIFRGCRYE